MAKPQHQVAEALRLVALRLERALEEGRRTRRLDADDLRETLLGVADVLDPPRRQKGASGTQTLAGRLPHTTPHVGHVGAFSR
jgi:hypothetical protein